jgi:hypothetical protein
MRIQTIVEGPGDIQAVPVLLRRIAAEIIGCPFISVSAPMKLDRGKMVKEEDCRRHLKIANLCADHVLLILDSDDDCCRHLHDLVSPWAADEVYRAGFDVIGIEKEYESWLLAGTASLRGLRGIGPMAEPPPDPNLIRGAKGYISRLMPSGTAYSETVDQAPLTARVDLAQVQCACRSFSRLVSKLQLAHQLKDGLNKVLRQVLI